MQQGTVAADARQLPQRPVDLRFLISGTSEPTLLNAPGRCSLR